MHSKYPLVWYLEILYPSWYFLTPICTVYIDYQFIIYNNCDNWKHVNTAIPFILLQTIVRTLARRKMQTHQVERRMELPMRLSPIVKALDQLLQVGID